MKSQTRRVYRYTETVPLTAVSLRRRYRVELRRLLARVWERYGRGPVPGLTFRRSADTSQAITYRNGDREIQLAPSHECVYVLLHEIAHLCVREKVEHGPRFMALYIKLMAEYGRMDEGELLINAGLYGIKVHGFTHH